MNAQTTMTMSVPDGAGGTIESGPFTLEDLKAAVGQVNDEAEMFQAAAHCIRQGGASTSLVQRKLGIGYNRAARLLEALEDAKVISPPNKVGKRTVVADAETQAVILAYAEKTELREAVDAVRGKTAPMRETAEDVAVKDQAYGIAAGELTQFIERVERLEEEKKEVAEQIKEVMAEAKGRGYDTKAMRKLIALRKRDPDDIAEEEAVLEMYKAALGMT